MTRGQHPRFIMIDVETVVADRRDHVKGLLIIADNGWVCFRRRCKIRVECDLEIGCLTASLGKFTIVGGRRGGGVLDRGILGIQTFNMSDFANDVGILSHIHVQLGLINCRDVTLRALELNGEWEGIKGTELRDLVCHSDDHFGLLDERQAKDGVDGNIVANCDHESNGSSFLCIVWQFELESHQ